MTEIDWPSRAAVQPCEIRSMAWTLTAAMSGSHVLAKHPCAAHLGAAHSSQRL